MRDQKGGFFAGLQLPTLAPVFGANPNNKKKRDRLPVPAELLFAPDRESVFGYPANFRLAGKEPYVAEKVFWGVYRLTGTRVPVLSGKGATGRPFNSDRQSAIPPDIGESEAMLAMVRKLDPALLRKGIHVTLNGYESKLSRDAYGADLEVVEKEKAIISEAKKMLGDFEVVLANTWGGLHDQVALLTPENQATPASAAAIALLDWARSQNLGINLWTVHSGPNPWTKLNKYYPASSDWNPAGYTCPANRSYMDWHTHVACRLLSRGYTSYAEDEHFVLQGQLICDSPLHDHLPGNCDYA